MTITGTFWKKFNSLWGVLSLKSLTTGDFNSAGGVGALGGITTGSNNTGNGYAAGAFIADGITDNATTGTSTYLGSQTKASADGVANEIVIGYNAIGGGSNTVTLGNASITSTILRGTLSYTGKISNRLVVGLTGNYTTLKAAVDWFNASATANTEILVDAGVHTIADTLTINNSSYILCIRGSSSSTTIINAATGLSGKPMFSVVTATFVSNLYINATTLASYGTNVLDNCFNITGNSLYNEFQNIYTKGFNKVINLTGASSIYLFNSIIDGTVLSGVTVNSTGVTLVDIEVNTFTNCEKAIDLVQSSSGGFDIMNNILKGVSGKTLINYTPATYVVSTYSSIISNKWNNVGVFYAGFDFTRTDSRDANIYVRSNAGKEDKKPHGKINVVNNATGTTISSGGTYYKAAFTNTSSYTCKFTIADNRFTYQSNNVSDVKLWISGSCKNSQNRAIELTVRKSGAGTNISPITVRAAATGQDTSFALIAYIDDMGAGEYVELFVSSANNNDVVTVTDLTMFAETM